MPDRPRVGSPSRSPAIPPECRPPTAGRALPWFENSNGGSPWAGPRARRSRPWLLRNSRSWRTPLRPRPGYAPRFPAAYCRNCGGRPLCAARPGNGAGWRLRPSAVRLLCKIDHLVNFCIRSGSREANDPVDRRQGRHRSRMAEVSPDIAAGRLGAAEYEAGFEADSKPPLDAQRALVEADRCYFCHDAPCVQACPTGIDIPGFIRKIQTGNLKGSAITILEQNIFGGACARVCPTEVLCEQACVRNLAEDKPVTIGLLQRHATDWLFENGIQPFARGARTGRRVAVVGGGPAGLACAHRLAMLGHDVTVFDARPKLGGLNEYGIAAYKVPDDFAQREVAFILSLGG